MRPHLILLVLVVVAGLPSSLRGAQSSGGSADEYASKIQAARQSRDKRFRDPNSSPLAVVAVARLDRSRTTIGSSPEVDLRLPSAEVAAIHAEVVREEAGGGRFRWLIRPVDGDLRDEQRGATVSSAELRKGDRYKIGEYLVYFDQLGTFGAVLRALDPRCPACADFTGLHYFPVDARFRVRAEVMPDPVMTEMMILDTNGWRRPSWKYGQVRFQLDGRDLVLQLWLFKPDPGPKDQFFIAFKDTTNGPDSYGGGRYLDVPFVKAGQLVLDFNEAYNPSCAYNTGFACPIPPAENRLPVAVRAGEKVYARH